MTWLRPWRLWGVVFITASACYQAPQLSSATYAASSIVIGDPVLSGSASTPVTINLLDSGGQPVRDALVQLACAGCDIAQPTALTDSKGAAVATVVQAPVGQNRITALTTVGSIQVQLPTESTLQVLPPRAESLRAVQVGTALNMQAAAQGEDGGIVATYQDTVTLRCTDPAATLPTDAYTFVPADHGVHLFPGAVVLHTVGTQTVEAIDSHGVSRGKQTYEIVPSPVGALMLSLASAHSVAGAPMQVTLSARDTINDVLTHYTGSLTLLSSDPNADLPGLLALDASDQGSRSVSLTLRTAGPQTLQVTDGVVTSPPVTVQVDAGPPAKLTLRAPAAAVAGVPLAIQLLEADAFGNPAVGATGTLTLTSSDPQANLPAPAAFVVDAQGRVPVPSVALRTSGNVSLTASTPGIPNVTSSVQITPAPATRWTLTPDAGAVWTAGEENTLTLRAVDDYNNIATGYTGSMRFTSSDANATLPAPVTFTAADAGVKYVPGTVPRTAADSLRVVATDVESLLAGGLYVQVLAAPVQSLQVSTPNPTYVNQSQNVLVRGFDAFGNAAQLHTVHLSSSDTNATLPTPGVADGNSQISLPLTFGSGNVQSIVATDSLAGASGSQEGINVRMVRALSSGYGFSCVIEEAGQVKCWGDNYGQLGLGDTVQRSDPKTWGPNLPAVDLGTGRTATVLSAHQGNVCVVLDTGALKCWGNNSLGQLGLGDVTNRGGNPNDMGDNLPPVDLGTGRTARAVSVGDSATCAILDEGSVKCWGSPGYLVSLGLGDTNGRGGNPNEMGDALPAVPLGTGRSAVAVSVGNESACAVLDTGDLKCWMGNAGELGLGDTTGRGAPLSTMGDALPAVDLGSGRTAVAVVVGDYQTCALLDTAQVKCWGFNYDGQLGLGDTTSRGDQPGTMGDNLPTLDFGAGRSVQAIGLSSYNTGCAALDNASIKCWGSAYGPLGIGDNQAHGNQPGTMGDALPAVALPPGPVESLGVSVGYSHACALRNGHSVFCWLSTTTRAELGARLPEVALW